MRSTVEEGEGRWTSTRSSTDAVAEAPRTTRRFGLALWIGALLAYAIFLTCLHFGSTSAWHLASPDKLVRFEAAEPFQYRILLPTVVAAVQTVLPMDEMLWFAILEVFTWMALVLLAHRALVLFDIGSSELIRKVLALTVVIPMLLHLIVPDLKVDLPQLQEGSLVPGTWKAQPQFHYVYDLPAAVFVFALVLLVVRFVRSGHGKFLAAYLALFPLATLNRETTVFLIPFFFMFFARTLDRATFVKALLLQVGLFVLIEAALQWGFAANQNPNASVPGTAYELHVTKNLELLFHPLYLPAYLARFGAGLYLLVLLFWRHLDPVLRSTLLWFGLPFMTSVLVLARLQEHRVFAEIVPLLWVGAVQAIAVSTARSGSLFQDRQERPLVISGTAA